MFIVNFFVENKKKGNRLLFNDINVGWTNKIGCFLFNIIMYRGNKHSKNKQRLFVFCG